MGGRWGPTDYLRKIGGFNPTRILLRHLRKGETGKRKWGRSFVYHKEEKTPIKNGQSEIVRYGN